MNKEIVRARAGLSITPSSIDVQDRLAKKKRRNSGLDFNRLRRQSTDLIRRYEKKETKYRQKFEESQRKLFEKLEKTKPSSDEEELDD